MSPESETISLEYENISLSTKILPDSEKDCWKLKNCFCAEKEADSRIEVRKKSDWTLKFDQTETSLKLLYRLQVPVRVHLKIRHGRTEFLFAPY